MAFDVSHFGLTVSTLPKGWWEDRLDSIVTLNPEQIGKEYPHEYIEYLDISNVERDRVEKPKRISLKKAPSRAKRIVTTNDTIISTVRPGNRGYAFLKDVPPNLIVSTGFAVLRAKDCDPRFLYYLATSDPIIDYLASIAEEKTAYPSVNPGDIAECHVPIPPLPEQHAIAHILGTLDDKIELLRRMNETLEAIARAIFKSWFVDFLPVRAKQSARTQTGDPVRAKAEGRKPFGIDDATAALFPDEFEESELGKIPKGWGVGSLGDVAEHPRRGIRPSEIEPSTAYIALEHMPKRCIALAEWAATDGLESNKFEFKRGEILFGKLRPYFHKVGVAPLDGVCSTDIVVVTPRTEKWFGFVLGHVSSTEFVDFTDAGSTGTKMPRTSWSEMARYEVAMPPEAVAEAFTEQIRPVVDRIIASIHKVHTLAAIRDALLPKLLSGEIRVKETEGVVEAKV